MAARFQGYGWNIERVGNANDPDLLAQAFAAFRKETDRPTLIIVDSHIGYGSPHKVDTAAAHGEPLGVDEVRETKRLYGWPEDAEFLVPDGVYEHFAAGIGAPWPSCAPPGRRGSMATARATPHARHRDRADAAPPAPRRLGCRHPGLRPRQGPGHTPGLQRRRQRHRPRVPWLVVGSADLTESTMIGLSFDGVEPVEPGTPGGRQLHYGVREHESAAISNGLSLSKLRPAWSTYLVFSDYARPRSASRR